MTSAAVSEIKARFSEFLGRVKAGDEVVITDRGRPVARLCPLARPTAAADDLSRLEKLGLVRLGSGKLPRGFWARARPEDPGGTVLGALLEERESGR
jgi:prevent-host-death family protein